MMNTCKDCKHWDLNPTEYSIPANTSKRECTCPKVCGETHRDEDAMEQWGQDAGYVDIATGPDFGCVHWEAKT